MRTLVTGGAGYIGSVMVSMLADGGHDVLVLDNLSRGHREAVKKAEISEVDLEDQPAVQKICQRFQPDACLHFAAHSLVEESVAKPLMYFKTNLSGSLNLLKALLESNCGLLVFSSTAAVYGIPGSIPIVEDSRTVPINPYGLSKLMFEEALGEVARAGGIRFVSLRYFNAAGADPENGLGEDHDPETHLVPRVIAAALGKEPGATIYGTDYPTPDGTCIRDYIHVSDLADAHVLAFEHLVGNRKSFIVNLGSETGISVTTMVEKARQITGRPIPAVIAPRRKGDPEKLVASSKKAYELLGWKARASDVETLLSSTWNLYKNIK